MTARGRRRVQPVKTIAHTFLLVMVTALSHGARALAHHSFAAEFDAEKPVTLKGTVVKWEMINPHGWITIDVTEPDGQNGAVDGRDVESERPHEAWLEQEFAETGRRDHRRGVPGQGRSNTANAARVTLADGRKVFAGSSGTPAGTPGTPPQER